MSTYQNTTPEERQAAYDARKATEARLVEDYKGNINLTAYLVDRGWTPIRGKHTQNWAALEQEATGRKVMVHRANGTGHYAYKSFTDDKDKGTIINLVGQELRLDLGTREGWVKLHAHLSPMVGNVYAPDQQIRPTTQKDFPRLDEAAIVSMLDLQPLTKRNWLHSRQIEDKTIDAPEFKGQIAQRPFKTKGGYEGINTAFPLRNMDHIVTANTRDEKHNMLVGPKNDALWMSNPVAGVKPQEIVIVENPLDALSHYQLYPPATPGERLYLASAGQPGGLQMGTVQRIIDSVKPERLVLGNDNDFSGIRFNIQYMGELKLPQQEASPWKAYLTAGNQQTQAHNQLRLSAPVSEQMPAGQSAAEVAQRLEKILNSGHIVAETKAVVTVGKTYQGNVEITASIPNNRSMLTRAENAVKEFRRTGELVVVKRSYEKDFNDDLKMEVSKRNELVQKIRDNRPESLRDAPVDLTVGWLKKLQTKSNNDRILAEKDKVKLGPTGLPVTKYTEGERKNILPDDGDLRASRTKKSDVDKPDKKNIIPIEPKTQAADSNQKPGSSPEPSATGSQKTASTEPPKVEVEKPVLGYVEANAKGERLTHLVEKNPYVLSSADGKITVGIDRNGEPVLETAKAVPTQFDAQSAAYLIEKFKGSTNGEKIILQSLSERDLKALRAGETNQPTKGDSPGQAYVITSSDALYTLDLDSKKKPVLLENVAQPGRFSEKYADHLLTTFKPEGGQSLKKMPETDFSAFKQDKLSGRQELGNGEQKAVSVQKESGTPDGTRSSEAPVKARPINELRRSPVSGQTPTVGAANKPGDSAPLSADSPVLRKSPVKPDAGPVGNQNTTSTRAPRR